MACVLTADAAVEAAQRLRPDVAVGDPDLSASDGRPVLIALHMTAFPTMRIVAFADAAELGPGRVGDPRRRRRHRREAVAARRARTRRP